MKAVSSVLLVLALVPLSACAPKVNDPADVQAIKAASLTWDKAWNSANAEAVVSGFYTADAARMDPNQPALVGQQAIRAASQKLLRAVHGRGPQHSGRCPSLGGFGGCERNL